MSLLLKILTHLGAISTLLKDCEQSIKDLFAGKLTRDEVSKLLSDVASILGSGLIPLPDGVLASDVVSLLTSGDHVVDDVLKAVGDLQSGGISSPALKPDLKSIAVELLAAAKSGAVVHFGGHSAVQAQEILQGIVDSLS